MPRKYALLPLLLMSLAGSALVGIADEPTKLTTPTTSPTPFRELKHESRIYSLALSPDGQILATNTLEKKGNAYVSVLHLWNLHDGNVAMSWETGSQVITALAFSTDGKVLALGNNKTISLWSREGKLQQTWNGHTDVVSSLVFSPDGKTLASGSLKRLDDKPVSELFLWDIATGTKRELPVEIPERHSFIGVPPALSFSAEGSQIVAPQSHFRVGIWDVTSGQLKSSIGDESVKGVITAVALSPDEKWLVTGHMGHELKVWDVATNTLQATLLRLKPNWNGIGPSGEVQGLIFKPDGQTLISAGTNQEGAGGEADLLIWNWPKQEVRASLLPSPAEGVKGFAYSADSSTFATVESFSTTVKVWRINP